jgi:hypothetical protein
VRGEILLPDMRKGSISHGVTAMCADGPCQAVRPVQLSRRVAVVDDDGVATP